VSDILNKTNLQYAGLTGAALPDGSVHT